MFGFLKNLFNSNKNSKKLVKHQEFLECEERKKRGDLFLAKGDFGNAIKEYEEALKINPMHAKVLCLLGFLLIEVGRLGDAKDRLVRSYEIDDSNEDTCYLLGVIEHGNSSNLIASRYYLQALERDSGMVVACEKLCQLCHELFLAQDVENTEVLLKQAIELNPRYSNFYFYMGNILKSKNELQDALKCYCSAIEFDSENLLAHHGLGAVYESLRQWEKAFEHYRYAAQNKQFIDTHWSLSHLLLLHGQYEEGFAYYECRLQSKGNIKFKFIEDALARVSSLTQWEGGDINGKDITVWVEQGLGDTIMMLRYLPFLKRRFNIGNLFVLCPSDLNEVVASLGCVDKILNRFSGREITGYHCSLMSMPYLFGTSSVNIPCESPYIHPSESQIQVWKERLAHYSDYKVGIVWAGGQLTSTDAIRSMPLSTLAPLMSISGINFFSLQKGGPQEQLTVSNFDIVDWMNDCQSVMDTAALIQQLDLVITVDTSIVHLAGALGKKCWLLNRYESEWRWGLVSVDSAWYPSVTIFRQKSKGDWHAVINEVSAELRALVS